jgi:hypothetical protein
VLVLFLGFVFVIQQARAQNVTWTIQGVHHGLNLTPNNPEPFPNSNLAWVNARARGELPTGKVKSQAWIIIYNDDNSATIRNAADINRCLDVSSWPDGFFYAATMACAGSASQKWRIEATANGQGQFRIRNNSIQYSTGVPTCLKVDPANGSNTYQWVYLKECEAQTSSAQAWIIVPPTRAAAGSGTDEL